MTHKQVLIGGDDGAAVVQLGTMSNRHGLIAGATGTGKTVTLQVLAEGFARMGTPVFAVDVKGDLSGVAKPGKPHKEVDRRLGLIPIDGYEQRGYPTLLWDIFGEQGHPVRTTVSEMGPLILSNLLELNETQTGVLYACFSVADDEGLLLLDLKDLRSMLAWVGENRKSLQSAYGNLAPASIGAIQRRLLVLEEQGADQFFGEPAISLSDFMQHDFSGNGVISLLAGDRLLRESPRLYAAFLMWLLSELSEELPEAGELDAPKLVLFFDEAHLMFKGMQKALLDRVEQVVRLIRSKGVGVYFCTQNPLDLPQPVLGQLGMKVQHALRAFTPNDQKSIRAVVSGFRSDGSFDVGEAITTVGVGEALVSTLLENGAPSPVARTLVCPPESRIGPVDDAERKEVLSRSPMNNRYEKTLDRESAYELLAERAKKAAEKQAELARVEAEEKARNKAARSSRSRSSNRQSVSEALLKSAARSVGRSLGSKLVRGILGSLLK